jgi:tRNA-2-methylthio-N6-dimethylallyladenosine synthase
MRYFIATYGCQANYADSERIARRLENQGYARTNQIEEADLVVINACSVRQSAVDRIYAKINKIHDPIHDPAGRVKIILAGCVLPLDKKKLRNKVSEIWHPDEYFDLPAGGPIYSSKSSAFVPIMTGCDNFCSYCAVPYTRGREKSRPAKEIIQEVKNLIKNDCKEIWLLGQNVNSYKGEPDFSSIGLAVGSLMFFKIKAREEKSGSPQKNKELKNVFPVKFPQLLKIINSLPGDFKIRFLTNHPKDMSDELIKTIAQCEKVSKEIHLPMQSGNNAILKKMNRKYTIGYYKNLIKKIRKYIPEAKISTDIIVGFPGETKKQFGNTAKAMKEIGFSKAYIACYSSRLGTAAFKLKNNIPHREKKERRRILEKILEEERKRIFGICRRPSGQGFREAEERGRDRSELCHAGARYRGSKNPLSF